jgi:hypothetical protein
MLDAKRFFVGFLLNFPIVSTEMFATAQMRATLTFFELA